LEDRPLDWTLLSADIRGATFWGPFASIDEAIRHRLPLAGG
jgi:hypothetical protein